jgi:hypothetical protein
LGARPDSLEYSPERRGGHDKAIENYRRIRSLFENQTVTTRLNRHGQTGINDESGYSYLNTTPSDVSAAERYARTALEVVPYWHYVRDILLPQILAAKAKAQ